MLNPHIVKDKLIRFMNRKFKAHEYLDTILEQNNMSVVVVTLESIETGIKRFVVPCNNQIANRVKYYVDNGINDFLETDLKDGKDLVDLLDFKINSQTNRFGEIEQIYFHRDLYKEVSKGRIISNLTRKKLEMTFLGINNPKELLNSSIISIIKSGDDLASIYLIGKFEEEEIYIGIVETEFTKKREIQRITLNEINELGDFKEVQTAPFYTKEFLTGSIVYCK